MDNNSGDENSEDGLQIVLDSPRVKKKTRKELTISEIDKKIIEAVEQDIEENLEQKAAKANLTAIHVKNILKEVVTNEHVLALVKRAEDPENNDEETLVYEPKFTRAKTKELLSTNTPVKILPWSNPTKPTSEVHRLFTEDLQEESSGDEYVPDSPFRNSTSKSKKQSNKPEESIRDEEANIARRTRSKLSLSHTPLEVIEGAFMPPDITTDMYDMDCDDDVWKEFLKTFTRPLDEVTKATEDEDHDPEYNILADEEIDEVDKEELRADRAVTVSRKEFNCLMAELFEYADYYESNKQNEKFSSTTDTELEQSQNDDNKTDDTSDLENDPNILIKKCQIPILAQQMRQHVQMLTQNFLLSYEHPEFYDMAEPFKQMLSDIVEGSEKKTFSIYNAINLQPAIKLIDEWEKLLETQNDEVVEHKRYVERILGESIAAKQAGTEYIVTFSPLLMKTIANSEVFIYTNLLPRIPFRSLLVTRTQRHFMTYGEQCLIALFLEQATLYLKQDPHHLTKFKTLNMQHVCHILHRLLMPHIKPEILFKYIKNKKSTSSEENPIKFFYRNKKAPPTVHYVISMDNANVQPPCRRSPEVLPHLWRLYLYPNYKNERNSTIEDICNNNDKCSDQVILVSYPSQLWSANTTDVSCSLNVNLPQKSIANRILLPKGLLPVLPFSKQVQRRRRREKRTKTRACQKTKANREIVSVSDGLSDPQNKMLPDMPSLGSTPIKKNSVGSSKTIQKNNSSATNEQTLSFKNITSNLAFEFSKPDGTSQIKRNFEGLSEFLQLDHESSDGGILTSSSEKDNPDDINELMKASSTVKNVTKKEPSGAEKKRAKLRREFVANIVMATPDDRETQNQKDENFADAFFEKLRQTLTLEDFDKLIHVLGHYDQTSGEVVELYKNVQTILLPNYKELSEEFLLFLTDIQAHKVGQLMPYFLMKNMDMFIMKLQVYFKDQPSQIKKIVKCLTDLCEHPKVTMDLIKNTVLPLLKGNAALTDWFLQIFPSERPPKLLTSGPHELIDISKELARPPDEDIYETVILPDTEDPYGGLNCICPCHNVEQSQFKSRTLHCKKCGLKFIQGKIYIQTGKAVRPAVVSFLTNPEKDHLKRLTATQRKRSDTSPSKQVSSPTKDNQPHEEPRNSNESEDEDTKKRNQKRPKVQRKRKIKDRDKINRRDSGKFSKETSSKTCDNIKSENVKIRKILPKRQNKKRPSARKNSESKPSVASSQQKRPAEEDIDYPEPAEFVELKVSSDHSGESESEFFESSQDVTNTDSEDSSSSTNLGGVQTEICKEGSWTRDEDKIILQALRQSSDNEETFKQISQILENRSVVEIKNRFHKLMSLLRQMNNSNSKS